jgi:hypothetical protein
MPCGLFIFLSLIIVFEPLSYLFHVGTLLIALLRQFKTWMRISNIGYICCLLSLMLSHSPEVKRWLSNSVAFFLILLSSSTIVAVGILEAVTKRSFVCIFLLLFCEWGLKLHSTVFRHRCSIALNMLILFNLNTCTLYLC